MRKPHKSRQGSIDTTTPTVERDSMEHDEQWALVCEPSFKRIEKGQAELKDQLERYHGELSDAIKCGAERTSDCVLRLEKAIYVDNGKTSIQTRLNDHDRVIRTLIWAAGIIGAAAMLSMASTIFNHVYTRPAVSPNYPVPVTAVP